MPAASPAGNPWRDGTPAGNRPLPRVTAAKQWNTHPIRQPGGLAPTRKFGARSRRIATPFLHARTDRDVLAGHQSPGKTALCKHENEPTGPNDRIQRGVTDRPRQADTR